MIEIRLEHANVIRAALRASLKLLKAERALLNPDVAADRRLLADNRKEMDLVLDSLSYL